MTDVVPLHLTDVVYPAGHPQEGERGVVLGFAVVHGDGVLIFDTGVGSGHLEVDRSYRPVHHGLPEALAARGLSLADVVAVANSHLHFDHCGQNQLFPGTPIYVQALEYRATKEPDFTVPGWVDFPGASYELLDGEAEPLPGIRAIPTHGHTPGHQSLVVQGEDGPVVLAGQAVYTPDEWEGARDARRSGEPTARDRDAYADSVRRLRDLDPVRVLFAHHQRAWERRQRT